MNYNSIGVPILDELLGGGISPSSTILIEAGTSTIDDSRQIVNTFVKLNAENGQPCVYITTDATDQEIQKELNVKSNKLYIFDLFSAIAGVESAFDSTRMVKFPKNVDDVNISFQKLETELKDKHQEDVIWAYSNLSTTILDLGEQNTIYFLRKLIARIKLNGQVLLAIINNSIYESVVKIIGHLFTHVIRLEAKEHGGVVRKYLKVIKSPSETAKFDIYPYQMENKKIYIRSLISEDFEVFKQSMYLDENGMLSILGVPYGIFSIDYIRELYEQSIKVDPKKTWEIYYNAGKYLGLNYAEVLESQANLQGIELIDSFIMLLKIRGYGILTTTELDFEKGSGKMASPKLIKSSTMINTTTYPVDAEIAGAIAGIFEHLLKKEVICEETMCVAKGDPFCEFTFKSKQG
ncbi:MAG: V4R domain-containing protein [Candidatus Helarchaeota archaeon]